MDVSSLLSNKWVLYGGAGLAALAGIWFLMPASAPADEGDSGAGWTASSLLPVSAGAGYAAAAGSSGIDTGYMDALISLENKKTDSTEKLTLAEIDAQLKTTMAVTSANLQLGLKQTESLNLQSFADIYSNATKLLSVDTITAVTGNFKMGDQVFSFDTARFQSGYPTQNQNTLNAISGYYGANRNVVPAAASPAGNAGQLRVASAPSAGTSGRSNAAIAPVTGGVASGQSAIASRRALVPAVADAARSAARR